MPSLTILFDGIELFNGPVDALESEITAAGTLSLNADFAPVEFEDLGLHTGAILDGSCEEKDEY